MYLLVITYRRSIIFAIIVSRSKDLKFYHLLGRLGYYGLLETGNKHSRSRKNIPFSKAAGRYWCRWSHNLQGDRNEGFLDALRSRMAAKYVLTLARELLCVTPKLEVVRYLQSILTTVLISGPCLCQSTSAVYSLYLFDDDLREKVFHST